MANKLLGVAVGLVLVSAGLAGCGSGSGSCGAVQPCGGSIAGTWRVVSTCVNSAALNMSTSATCPQLSVSENVSETGTVTFNADMSYSAALSVSATLNENIPVSCLSGETCAQLNSTIGAASSTDGGVTTSAVCSGSATVCNCQISINDPNATVTGTYSTSGTMLTVTPAGSGTTTDGYCVQGTMLHLTSMTAMTANMGAMGQMPIASELVLERQ